LDNLLPRLEHKIVAVKMSFPGTELASHFLADDCLLARQRRMLLGVADELVDLSRRASLKVTVCVSVLVFMSSFLAPRQVLEVGGSRFTARWS